MGGPGRQIKPDPVLAVKSVVVKTKGSDINKLSVLERRGAAAVVRWLG